LLKSVKEQSRAVPGDGLGYGLLRYLNDETGRVLAASPSARIGFNYMGRFVAGDRHAVRPWEPVGGIGSSMDPAMDLPHALEVSAIVRDLPDGPELVLMVEWRGELLDETGIDRLGRAWLDTLSGLAGHVADPAAGGHTASDFVLLDLEQDEIEDFEAIAAELSEGQAS
jgi:nonribosomal peptide synthetase CepA